MNKKSAFLNSVLALAAVSATAFSASPLNAQSADDFRFVPNTLVLMRSVYAGDASTVTFGETLPPNCVNGNVPVPIIGGGTVSVAVSCGVATADGTFPGVFNNAVMVCQTLSKWFECVAKTDLVRPEVCERNLTQRRTFENFGLTSARLGLK